jgi:hypothetical protein
MSPFSTGCYRHGQPTVSDKPGKWKMRKVAEGLKVPILSMAYRAVFSERTLPYRHLGATNAEYTLERSIRLFGAGNSCLQRRRT